MNYKKELNETFDNMSESGITFGGGFNVILAKYRNKLLGNIIKHQEPKEPKILEVGGADGLCTKFLADRFSNVTVLEPVESLACELQSKFKNVTVYCKTLEEFDSNAKFDYIIAFNVLEHTEDDDKFLEYIRRFMHNKSSFILTVPNARSMHRQLGKELGIINNIFDLTDTDKLVGHKRYYDYTILNSKLRKNGFWTVDYHGVILKPFPNNIMLQLDKYYDGLHSLGYTHRENGAELFVLSVKYENIILS